MAHAHLSVPTSALSLAPSQTTIIHVTACSLHRCAAAHTHPSVPTSALSLGSSRTRITHTTAYSLHCCPVAHVPLSVPTSVLSLGPSCTTVTHTAASANRKPVHQHGMLTRCSSRLSTPQYDQIQRMPRAWPLPGKRAVAMPGDLSVPGLPRYWWTVNLIMTIDGICDTPISGDETRGEGRPGAEERLQMLQHKILYRFRTRFHWRLGKTPTLYR